MHALVVMVSIAQGQLEAARKSLHDDVVPRVIQAPGFVKGYWSAALDGGSGLSFVVFKTKEDAENVAQMARSNPTPPGVSITGVEIREVIAEA